MSPPLHLFLRLPPLGYYSLLLAIILSHMTNTTTLYAQFLPFGHLRPELHLAPPSPPACLALAHSSCLIVRFSSYAPHVVHERVLRKHLLLHKDGTVSTVHRSSVSMRMTDFVVVQGKGEVLREWCEWMMREVRQVKDVGEDRLYSRFTHIKGQDHRKTDKQKSNRKQKIDLVDTSYSPGHSLKPNIQHSVPLFIHTQTYQPQENNTSSKTYNETHNNDKLFFTASHATHHQWSPLLSLVTPRNDDDNNNNNNNYYYSNNSRNSNNNNNNNNNNNIKSNSNQDFKRPLLRGSPMVFGALDLWKQGYTGTGVRVAIFDTGLSRNVARASFKKVVERTDWTDERTLDDKVGHGTFVAGMIGGIHIDCPGLAPDVEIITFRVFTGTKISFTSWFLDAFNYALMSDIDILNLSIGGPDFADQPFTDKINELTASGVIVISAIGNDGPLYGSLNNPADMLDVIGVGGVEWDGTIASFSSRGSTKFNPYLSQITVGRVKPDVVTFARSLVAPSHLDPKSCQLLSGTSVASPVVAGAVALLVSIVPREHRNFVINPASMKHALLNSAKKIQGSNMFEQGAGLLDLPAAAEIIKRHYKSCLQLFKPQNISSDYNNVKSVKFGPQSLITLFPAYIDMRKEACQYMWPFCDQPLYPSSLPLLLNISVLYSVTATAFISNIQWFEGKNGDILDVSTKISGPLWPWSTGLGVFVSVKNVDLSARQKYDFDDKIFAEGFLRIHIHSQLINDSYCDFPMRIRVVSIPPKERRILWDIYHSIQYPPGYIPPDNLRHEKDMLDWLGDHPYSNFHVLYRNLRVNGFYIEVWNEPITCLPPDTANRYGIYLVIDSEDFFTSKEIKMVENLVKIGGMSLVVCAEWYNARLISDLGFIDDNTRSKWTASVGGSNIPALNNLLRPFNIAFGDDVITGNVTIDSHLFSIESGVPILKFPKNGEIVKGASKAFIKQVKRRKFSKLKYNPIVWGHARVGSGSVVVMGDTNCIDTAYPNSPCYDFFMNFISLIPTISYRADGKVFRDSEILSQDYDRMPPEGVDPLPNDFIVPLSHVIENLKSGSPLLQDPIKFPLEGDLRCAEPRVPLIGSQSSEKKVVVTIPLPSFYDRRWNPDEVYPIRRILRLKKKTDDGSKSQVYENAAMIACCVAATLVSLWFLCGKNVVNAIRRSRRVPRQTKGKPLAIE